MVELKEYRDFFKKKEEERVKLEAKQNNFLWKEDLKVAKFLGTNEVYLVALICNVFRYHDLAQQKISREQKLNKEEELLLDLQGMETESNNSKQLQHKFNSTYVPKFPMESTLTQITPIMKPIEITPIQNSTPIEISYDIKKEKSITMMEKAFDDMQIDNKTMVQKRDHDEQELSLDINKIPTSTKKDMMLLKEIGIVDYGAVELLEKDEAFIEEHINNKTNKKAKQDEDENIHNSIWAPKIRATEPNQLIQDIYSSIWANSAKFSSKEKPNEIAYFFTIWDLPKEMAWNEIKKYLNYFGVSSLISWQNNYTTKAAHIKILTLNEKHVKALKDHWSITLSQGRTYRTTPGEFNFTEVEKRNEHRATIHNLPLRSLDSLLLRQLKYLKVQAVHILKNSNGNQARRAHVYFKSQQDKRAALGANVYYFNTKLEWCINENNLVTNYPLVNKGKTQYYDNGETIHYRMMPSR